MASHAQRGVGSRTSSDGELFLYEDAHEIAVSYCLPGNSRLAVLQALEQRCAFRLPGRGTPESHFCRGSADRIHMKTLLLLLLCIVASSVGIATTEGVVNTLSQYLLMGTTVISAIVLLTGVTD
jgi:hypothetical protein